MKRVLPLLGLVTVLSAVTRADGIPEPGIVLYGNVTNANRALRSGQLTVECTGPSGKVVRVTTQLNGTGPYGYRLRVPFESVVGGNTARTDAYTLDGRTTTVRLTEAHIPMADPGSLTANHIA